MSNLIFGLILLMQAQPDSIYIGKSLKWVVYFDDCKSKPIVEIGGVKYGLLDQLQVEDESIAKSKIGKLYKEGGVYYYENSLLGIRLRLEKRQYSRSIDNQRYKIFNINAFSVISGLKDSLNVKSYNFGWSVREDYLYYRDNDSMPSDYMPKYERMFYDSLK